MPSKTTVKVSNTNVFKQYRSDLSCYFYNEITCLTLLEKYFTPRYFNYYSFPKIISINRDNLSFTMSNCGNSVSAASKIKPYSLENQLKNIFFNLKLCNILYKDIHPENVCVDTDGRVCLIDFEVAFLMDYENYKNVITFERGSYKWSDEYYNNYYNKPTDLTIYNNLNFKSPKREWKGKPWSIYQMFIN